MSGIGSRLNDKSWRVVAVVVAGMRKVCADHYLIQTSSTPSGVPKCSGKERAEWKKILPTRGLSC